MKKYSETFNFPICTGCEHERLLYCNKYKEECASFNEKQTVYQMVCPSCYKQDGYEEKTSSLVPIEPTIKAKFSIPSTTMISFIDYLLEEKIKYPEAFYENREINEVYGAFPGTMWTGTPSLLQQPFYSLKDIENVKREIENLGLKFNLAWNNHLISGDELKDKYCNLVTDIFHNGNHRIIVSSPELFDYLIDKYPNFEYCQSMTQTFHLDDFVKTDDRYKMFFASQKINNNWDLLDKIPEEDRNNIIFTCDDYCFPMCQRLEHYEIVNYCSKNFAQEAELIARECPIDWNFVYYNRKRWPSTILPEQVDFYLQKGFSNFRLVSRKEIDNTALFYKLCKYLVKPPYFEDIFFKGHRTKAYTIGH